MARISVDDSFCKGCGLCVDACPEQIMALDRDKITVKGYHPAYCTDLDACTDACPARSCALTLRSR